MKWNYYQYTDAGIDDEDELLGSYNTLQDCLHAEIKEYIIAWDLLKDTEYRLSRCIQDVPFNVDPDNSHGVTHAFYRLPPEETDLDIVYIAKYIDHSVTTLRFAQKQKPDEE